MGFIQGGWGKEDPGGGVQLGWVHAERTGGSSKQAWGEKSTEWVPRAQQGPCWPQRNLNLELDLVLSDGKPLEHRNDTSE